MEEQSKTKKNIFKIGVDLLFSIGGLVAMNGVIQLLLYPSMKRALGDEIFGNILSLLAVVSVLATSFGTAANYGRMVAKKEGRSNNGDFNLFLLLSFIPAIIVTIISARLILGSVSILAIILICLLSIFSILRYYGDVEYRLHINYKMFFIYYLIISLGCVIGSLLVTKHVFGDNYAWIFAITTGEFLCFLFVLTTGSIYKGKDLFKASEQFKTNIKTIMFLVGTNFINALVLQADKLLLKAFQSGEAVTIFYVATLIGKIIALLTTPLNSIIIGYLTKYEGKITRKFFTVAVALAGVVGVVFTLGGFFVSHGFVYLMYNDLYNTAKEYFLLANAGQVLYFVSGSMMIVVLRFVHEKYQLIINMCYAALFAAVVIPLVYFFGLWGITWGLLVVNAIRFAMVVVIGYIKIFRNEKQVKEEISK